MNKPPHLRTRAPGASATSSEQFDCDRRQFLKTLGLAGGVLCLDLQMLSSAGAGAAAEPSGFTVDQLPKGSAPAPLEPRHFPDPLHAFVWRNWTLVPIGTMARVVRAQPANLLEIGKAMGLSEQPRITIDQQRRSYITVIRRNWHLLPYEQLLELLGWTPSQMAFALREDDFLLVKLGHLKPACEPIRFSPPGEAAKERARQIARTVEEEFPGGFDRPPDPPFGFVERLSSEQPAAERREQTGPAKFSPRFCYSYFALYGDPLLEKEADPYPDGYLARLSSLGVDGVWLQGVLNMLSPFPWESSADPRREERLAGLRSLVARARRHGIGVYVYLNEPRAKPLEFHGKFPGLKGVVEGDHAALCTSHPAVQQWLADSVAHVARAVPDLAGFFTISGSENLTNCWSHGNGRGCPRCGQRTPSEVIAEVNSLFYKGIESARSKARLIVWDWGWADDWVPGIIERLPLGAALMSVSEWSMPISRGGVAHQVGEYSISTVGPGPRARKHWALARQRGMQTIAKIQAGNTWELSAVPYIPALENVARHIANLLEANLDGLMLGWTLGGYPSPNLEVVAEVERAVQAVSRPEGIEASGGIPSLIDRALNQVARRRFGATLAPAVVGAWREFSAAFSQFPYDGSLVYNAPMQYGPSNLLWSDPTGYRASMIGFPYDDLDGWRGPYPPEIFIAQFELVAGGFEKAIENLEHSFDAVSSRLQARERQEMAGELSVARAASIHFRSVANQARFVQARRKLAAARGPEEAHPLLSELEDLLLSELALARKLEGIQSRDSRIGFEATNHYYYVPIDLAEKVLNCRYLLDRWLPAEKARRQKEPSG
jgi:hypothetical protein